MIPHFEKGLRSAAPEIMYTLFFFLIDKLFNVDINRVRLILLSLLLNVIASAIS